MGRPRKDVAIAAKAQSGRLSRPPYAMPLDTIGNVRRELGRLYRASLSGRIDTAEAARLAFILKEVRASLESEAESQTEIVQLTPPLNLTIYSVPRGAQIAADGSIHYPDGTLATAAETAFTPASPTPPLSPLPARTDQFARPVVEMPEPVTIDLESEPAVTRLDSWRSRRREDDGSGAA